MSPGELGERLAALEAQVAALRDTVRREAAELRKDYKALHETIHGPPWENSLRKKVHDLQEANAAANAAQAALAAARELQRQQGERRFTRRERIVIVTTAVVGSLLALGTFALALVAAVT